MYSCTTFANTTPTTSNTCTTTGITGTTGTTGTIKIIQNHLPVCYGIQLIHRHYCCSTATTTQLKQKQIQMGIKLNLF
jgi:hypothetical protein